MQSIIVSSRSRLGEIGRALLPGFWSWAHREWREIRLSVIKSSANKGDRAAQYKLALLYEAGELRPPTPHKALQLLRGAAYNGYVPAQLHLGQKYKNGIDMPRNETEANVWFRKAADMGNAEAQFSLGEYFALAPTGHGDLAQGLRWLRMAARQNHAEAAALLDKLTNTEVASEEQQAA